MKDFEIQKSKHAEQSKFKCLKVRTNLSRNSVI